MDLYLDADGCPVKDEAYRVARRYALSTYVVSNRPMRVPLEEGIRPVVVGDAFDAADDWIAERAGPGDVVVTADLLLAKRCIKGGANVLGPRGEVHDADSIGGALASRELADQLRQMGVQTGGPAPFSPRDRSAFLGALDATVQQLRRAAAESLEKPRGP